jgi:hypothetical protein
MSCCGKLLTSVIEQDLALHEWNPTIEKGAITKRKRKQLATMEKLPAVRD